MHTLHYVAVKLDDHFDGTNSAVLREEASDQVHSTLLGDERPYGSWYDWFVSGGGRFTEGYAYANSYDSVILFGEDKDKFLSSMNEALSWALAETQRLYEEVQRNFDLDSAVAHYERTYNNNTVVEGHSSMGAWTMRRLVSLLDNYWNPDSHFLDITNGTPQPRYLLDDIERNPDEAGQWALVPTDFHY